MARLVQCVKLKREAEGLDFPPYPGDLGRRVFDNVSKEAWKQWLEQQKMLVNENGSPRGGHWTAVIKNGDDPAVYYLNSLKNKVVTYSTIQDFVDRFIQQEFSSRIQFAFVVRIANYVNPIRRYDEHLQ